MLADAGPERPAPNPKKAVAADAEAKPAVDPQPIRPLPGGRENNRGLATDE
jgi:hypothetical protein